MGGRDTWDDGYDAARDHGHDFAERFLLPSDDPQDDKPEANDDREGRAAKPKHNRAAKTKHNRAISARYSGVCPTCGDRIRVGELIVDSPKGWRHTDCLK